MTRHRNLSSRFGEEKVTKSKEKVTKSRGKVTKSKSLTLNLDTLTLKKCHCLISKGI